MTLRVRINDLLSKVAVGNSGAFRTWDGTNGLFSGLVEYMPNRDGEPTRGVDTMVRFVAHGLASEEQLERVLLTALEDVTGRTV